MVDCEPINVIYESGGKNPLLIKQIDVTLIRVGLINGTMTPGTAIQKLIKTGVRGNFKIVQWVNRWKKK